MSRSPPAPTRILQVYGPLTGFSRIFSQDGLNNTWLSQVCILETSFYCENGGESVHSKDKEGGDKPLTAQAQLKGQRAVTFFQ